MNKMDLQLFTCIVIFVLQSVCTANADKGGSHDPYNPIHHPYDAKSHPSPPVYGHSTPVYGYPPPNFPYQSYHHSYPQPVGYDTYVDSTPGYGHQTPPYIYPQVTHPPVYHREEDSSSSSSQETSEESEEDSSKSKSMKEMLKMDKKEKEELAKKDGLDGKELMMMKEMEEEKIMMKMMEKIKSDINAPECIKNTSKPWCVHDSNYPKEYIRQAIEYHFTQFLNLYADVEELDTLSSVDRASTLKEETYLCPSVTEYIQPVYARNIEGHWRMIINGIELHYKTITQTLRVEYCKEADQSCPLVPHCYSSKCLQKSQYHRFLVFDEQDQYFPFAIETFKLPLACSCHVDQYEFNH